MSTALTINMSDILSQANCKPGVWYHVKLIGYGTGYGELSGSITTSVKLSDRYKRHPRSSKRARIYQMKQARRTG